MTAQVHAAVDYATPSLTITENFDSLPSTTHDGAPLSNSGGTIMTDATRGYTTGWVNDTQSSTSPDDRDLGVKGWYLYHDFFTGASPSTTSPSGASDAGASSHSHYIQGGGSASGTGGFWGFVSPPASATQTTSPVHPYSDKALGAVPTSAGATAFSNASFPMRIVYEVKNTTGAPLTSFTLTYDGEQYMDGRSATLGALNFDYSLDETAASLNTYPGHTGTYTSVPALKFTSPNAQNYVAASGAAVVVDGNADANRTAGITATVTGINWLPDTSIFLRWNTTFLGSGQSDGLAIDNIQFSALPEPTALAVLALGGLGMTMRRRRTA